MMKRFGVVGNPVLHSLSPQIHQAFGQECGIALSYEKYCVETVGHIFEHFVRDFFREGGAGLNITLPFKQRAFELADQLTERARLAGAVNTLIPLSSEKILGDNTDGVGLLQDLKEHHQSLSNKKILILGFGGATKGILPVLLAENPDGVVVARRRSTLCLLDEYAGVRMAFYNNLINTFDVIINTTPLSLSNELPPIAPAILHANSFCYDLFYHPQRETIFTHWAREHGVKASDGLGMLVHQAAEAFYQWHRVMPIKLDEIISNLTSTLKHASNNI